MSDGIRKTGKNSWEFNVNLGRDAGGKRLRKYFHVKGTRAEAKQKRRELLMSHHKGIPIAAGKITVREWLAKWMREYVVPNTRQKTIERYQGIIDRHVIPEVGHVGLLKLTPSAIQAMKRDGSKGSGTSPHGYFGRI